MTEDYDEFAYFDQNAAEFGIAWTGAPAVRRVHVDVTTDGPHTISGLQWGEGEPEILLVHGGAQNAHTWDTVALALDRPLLALDLPGHGHSSHRDDHAYWPALNAAALRAAIHSLGVSPRLVVGMSLGGLSAIALAAIAPDLVPALLLVDVTPGVDDEKASAIIAFVDGPETFESFDEILERTIAFNPTRSEQSLRRGVMHNARRRDDGRWEWRYDLPRRSDAGGGEVIEGLSELWDQLESHDGTLVLARGGDSPVVSDADVAELKRRRPDCTVHTVEGAGHSIQGDRPVELAALIETML